MGGRNRTLRPSESSICYTKVGMKARVFKFGTCLAGLALVGAVNVSAKWGSMAARRPVYSPRYNSQIAAYQLRQQQLRSQTNQPPRQATNTVQMPAPRYVPPPPAPKLDPEKVEAEKKRLDQNTVKWLKLRAEEGSSAAQYNLGVRYLTGEGVEQNIDEARILLRKSADAGEERAQRKLEQLDRAPQPVEAPK